MLNQRRVLNNLNLKVPRPWSFYSLAGIFFVSGFSIAFFFWGAVWENAGLTHALDFVPRHSRKNNVFHIPEPETVKGIYLSAAAAGSYRLEEILDLVRRTELNTLVMDLKDWKGRIAFKVRNPNLKEFQDETIVIREIDERIKKIHEAGLYLVGRIAVFQDPAFADKKPEWAILDKRGGLWNDFKGQTWLDPSSRDVWNYNLNLALEAHTRGFDEINFDYIRFPSDGILANIRYPFWDGKSKTETIKSLFKYLDDNLRRNNIKISVDLFGLTCCHDDDMNIGQRIIDAYPYFDAVSPMVYPSHYRSGFQGFRNPAEYPYEVVKYSLEEGLKKRAPGRAEGSKAEGLKILNEVEGGEPDPSFAKLRPWLQDFDLGANYDAVMVRKQIQAVYDAGADGWMLWNARNVYTEAALLKNQ